MTRIIVGRIVYLRCLVQIETDVPVLLALSDVQPSHGRIESVAGHEALQLAVAAGLAQVPRHIFTDAHAEVAAASKSEVLLDTYDPLHRISRAGEQGADREPPHGMAARDRWLAGCGRGLCGGYAAREKGEAENDQ